MKRYVSLLVVVLWMAALIPAGTGNAEQFNGGLSYQYVTSAKTIPKGAWQLMSHSRAALVSLGGGESVNTGTLASSLNYGAFNHFELEITSLLYQYVNDPASPGTNYASNAPDGGYFRWKLGDIRLMNKIYFGIQGSARMSLGDYTNAWLEPYYTEANAAGINYLFSYFQNPDYPEDGLQIHYNGGYYNYNDGVEIMESTDAIQVFFGIIYPLSRKFVGSFESQATYFRNRPEEDPVGMDMTEHYSYFTPSVTWKFASGWSFTAGVDVLVYGGIDMTKAKDLNGNVVNVDNYPNYPTWRASYKLIWRPGAVWGERHRGRGGRGRWQTGQQLPYGAGYNIQNRVMLYDWGGYAEEDLGYVETELEKIREDRKKAEEDLQKIKEKLKKESGQGQSK